MLWNLPIQNLLKSSDIQTHKEIKCQEKSGVVDFGHKQPLSLSPLARGLNLRLCAKCLGTGNAMLRKWRSWQRFCWSPIRGRMNVSRVLLPECVSSAVRQNHLSLAREAG